MKYAEEVYEVVCSSTFGKRGDGSYSTVEILRGAYADNIYVVRLNAAPRLQMPSNLTFCTFDYTKFDDALIKYRQLLDDLFERWPA